MLKLLSISELTLSFVIQTHREKWVSTLLGDFRDKQGIFGSNKWSWVINNSVVNRPALSPFLAFLYILHYFYISFVLWPFFLNISSNPWSIYICEHFHFFVLITASWPWINVQYVCKIIPGRSHINHVTNWHTTWNVLFCLLCMLSTSK